MNSRKARQNVRLSLQDLLASAELAAGADRARFQFGEIDHVRVSTRFSHSLPPYARFIFARMESGSRLAFAYAIWHVAFQYQESFRRHRELRSCKAVLELNGYEWICWRDVKISERYLGAMNANVFRNGHTLPFKRESHAKL